MASLHLSSGILKSTADALRGLSRLPSISKPNRLWPEKAPIIMAASGHYHGNRSVEPIRVALDPNRAPFCTAECGWIA
jgi:hypothetical protein